MTNKQIVTIEIEELSDADSFLNLLNDKNIPIIGACICLNIDNDYILKPVCDGKHIIMVSKRHSEIASELLRSIEEDFPIMY